MRRPRASANDADAATTSSALTDAKAVIRRLDRLQALTDTSLSNLPLDALLSELLVRIQSLLTVDTAAILLLVPDEQTLVARATIGTNGQLQQGTQIPLDEGIASLVATERRTVVATDIAQPTTGEEGLRSVLGVPLLIERSAIGVLQVGTLERREFDEDDGALLQLAADRAAIAIDRAYALENAQAARAEAERHSNAKTEFISLLAHETRTPLTAVIGFAELLQIDASSNEQRKWADAIARGGRHMLHLVNDLLEIARIEAKKIELAIEPVSVDALVDEALALMLPMARERSIDVERVDSDAFHRDVQADPARLTQVLLNLVSNAIKFNRDDGSVVVSAKESGDQTLVIAVADTGPGIDPERISELFTPFERLGAESGSVQGTGLGLAVAKGLVEAMGGTLSVESAHGEGSTFLVELPQAPTHKPRVRHDREKPVELRSDSSIVGDVLYIEDEPANVELVKQLLARLRPAVKLHASPDGRSGIERATQHVPDLLLLDLHLPDIAGSDVLCAIREQPQTVDVPVIIVSAAVDSDVKSVSEMLREDADAYLTKPFNLNRFLDLIDRALGP